jgi:PTS hybrid protein
VRDAIRRADQGSGVVVLGDLGSAILTIRHVLESRANGHVKLIDAPIVEGTVAAAVMASAGSALDDVVVAAEEARGARKL